MKTPERTTETTTATSMRGLRRATRMAAAAILAAVTTHAANVSEVSVSLNSTAYVKLDVQGTLLKDTLSLSGITAFNGAEQVDFVCVSNRPYETSSTAISGLPAGSYVHQLSVFNNWDGSRTRSYRVQLAQPDGTTDIYARIPCVTISQEGVNLVDYPDIRDFKDDPSKIAGSYTDDANIAGFPVTKLRLRRIDAPYIESDGRSGISTGYRMKGTSRVEVDFSVPNVDDPNEWTQCKVLGTDTASIEPNLAITLYLTYNANNQNKFFAIRAKTSDANESIKYKLGVDTDRHTAIVDLLEDKVFFITDGTTNSLVGGNPSFDRDFSNAEAVLPLSLFGRFANAYATTFANQTKSRIYGVRIFENGIPVHNFVPCLKEGVACFKDLVNGGFIIGENASAFTAGGDVPTFADDAYVSTAANADGGKLYFNTGYKTTDKSAVAIDCALTVNRNLGGSIWRLFQEGSANIFDFNLNGNAGLRYQVAGTYKNDFTTAFKETLYDDKDVRRAFYLDNRGQAAVVTSGHTNQLATFTQSATISHTQTLKLASNWANNSDFAAIKIYGCKIWEDGALVRDFTPYVNNGTPGLRDTITGAFIAASRNSSDTTSELAYGGTIVEDAYIQSAGTANMSTDYKMNGSSRLEVDFSLISTATQQRLFGTDSGETFKTYLYIDGSSNYSMLSPWGQTYTTHKADTIRHTAIIDVNHGWSGLVTGCTTNWSKTTTTSYVGQEADKALPLFGRGSAYATERIYSVRIYESDALVHEFIPYGRDGVAGFYDTVTGDIISNGSSFTFGGRGQDHGQLKSYVSPVHAEAIGFGKTTTLTAYAPGATSYRWLTDGEPVAGGADGNFEVTWANGGVRAESGYVHTYQAIAVFDDFHGATRESEPSAPETVTSRNRALIFVVR
ncbi:MAG: hypothetical protein IJQ73_04515 [Kiritimatiellae bacterium]|nr:hypothetical protein [Kiritimatiellia bacterium]